MAVTRDTIHKAWRCADGAAVKNRGETDWVALWEPSLALIPRWDLCWSVKYKTQATQTCARMHTNQRHLLEKQFVSLEKSRFPLVLGRGKAKVEWSLLIRLIEDQKSCILGRAKEHGQILSLQDKTESAVGSNKDPQWGHSEFWFLP